MNYLDKNDNNVTSHSVRLLGGNYQHFSSLFFELYQIHFSRFL
jgi:hypothetical protein